MRIIGGKDYYDAVGYDSEPARVFIRGKYKDYFPKIDANGQVINKEPTEINLFRNNVQLLLSNGKENYQNGWYWVEKNVCYEMSPVLIFFCGNMYRGIRVVVLGKYFFFWTADAFRDFLAEHNVELKEKRKSIWKYDDSFYLEPNTAEEYFKPFPYMNDYIRTNKIVTGIQFRKTSTWSKNPDSWIFNTDGLDAYQFYKKVDQWQANQQIDMYIGSLLVDDQDKMVKVSDKSLAIKHGFDKWSFRNKVHPAKPRGESE